MRTGKCPGFGIGSIAKYDSNEQSLNIGRFVAGGARIWYYRFPIRPPLPEAGVYALNQQRLSHSNNNFPEGSLLQVCKGRFCV